MLFESATGLALFSSDFHEEIGHLTKTVQDSLDEVSKFGKMVKLVSFVPFKDAAHALEVANDVSEGQSIFHFRPAASGAAQGSSSAGRRRRAQRGRRGGAR